tara:strand:- start:1410 stop:3131 length:1722 start_codon:yes stop_codon:yes gene_type:complete
MCGIIGTIGQKIDKKIIENACDKLSSRGPDDAGLFYNDNDNVALGHRRLSIIDLSEAGHQPMESQDGRYVISFNGEIYNYLELKEMLSSKYQFKTKTDTEVLLAAYQLEGEKCLAKLNGMFAFAIWDKKEKKLFCARDRVGIKPFFYHISDKGFSFASEIKALLALGIKARANEKIIFDYLYHGLYDHTDETFFNGINSLPPGHYLIWQDSHVAITKYWDVAGVSLNKNLDEQEARDEFVNLLEDSISLRFRSDVPVGVNLSSGVDSNSIYHYGLKVTQEKLHTFSKCMISPEYNECEVLEDVLSSEQKKYWHRSTITAQEAFSRIPQINKSQDQPFGGALTIGYDKMISLAKDAGITVLLEGQGGDELLAGYECYKDSDSPEMTSQGTIKVLHQDVLNSDFVKRHTYRTISFPKPFGSKLANAQYRDFRYTKLPRVLRFNDHATMSYSRELRLPFLDHRIVEFCFSLPDEYKIRDQRQKVLLRDAMKNVVPNKIHKARKKDSGAIQVEWFRDYYKESVYELLDSESFKTRPFWDHKKLRKRVDAFYSGELDNSFFIWQCLNLELWFREYIDS